MKNSKKITIKTNRHTGKEIGIEVRKSHFLIGTDNSNFKTQYQYDYNKYPIDDNRNFHSAVNSPSRLNNIRLGEHSGNYATSQMLQNKDIEKVKSSQNLSLDDKVKSELINSHFKLGSFKNNYKTAFQSDFEFVSPCPTKTHINNKEIENSLRSHSYVLGNYPLDYLSENKLRFSSPDFQGKVNGKSKISTYELMKSNYKFGHDSQNWETTSQASFFPLPNSKVKYNDGFMKTHFNLGDDSNKYGSTNKNSMILPKTNENPNQPNMSKELKKQYFKMGHGYKGDPEPKTIIKNDLNDPKNMDTDIVNKKVDTFLAMASHFALGEKHDNPQKTYETVYKIKMDGRPVKSPVENQRKNDLQTMKISDRNDYDFLTEKQHRYDLKKNETTRKEIEEYKKNVIGYYKGQHWNLGTDKVQISSTAATSMNYDREKAKYANLSLGDKVESDLKSVHYRLGYSKQPFSTTHLASYKPLETVKKSYIDPRGKKTHIEFNPIRNGLQGQTIYKSDYVFKELEG